jgi:hypothetical protein
MDVVSRVAIGLPKRDELIAGSALLAACPRLSSRFEPEEIALSEYCYYSTQTYIFEVVGFQLLGEMASGLRNFDVVHELCDQAREEAQHAHVYRQVVEALPVQLLSGALDVHATPIYESFVKCGTIEEKVVASYFVLESVAVGIFAARQRCYRTSPLARIDHQILVEEADHQAMGIRLVTSLVRDGRLTVRQVHEIVREASEKVADLLVPTALCERFGIDRDVEGSFRHSGFLAVQQETSRKAIMNSVRRLRRALTTETEEVLCARVA